MKSNAYQCKRNLLRLASIMDKLDKAGAVILDATARGSRRDLYILLAQGLEQLAKDNGLEIEEYQPDPTSLIRRVVLAGVPIEQFVH